MNLSKISADNCFKSKVRDSGMQLKVEQLLDNLLLATCAAPNSNLTSSRPRPDIVV